MKTIIAILFMAFGLNTFAEESRFFKCKVDKASREMRYGADDRTTFCGQFTVKLSDDGITKMMETNCSNVVVNLSSSISGRGIHYTNLNLNTSQDFSVQLVNWGKNRKTSSQGAILTVDSIKSLPARFYLYTHVQEKKMGTDLTFKLSLICIEQKNK